MCEHEWWVFSTCTGTGELMVECARCQAFGVVPEPTSDEWRRSFYAPEHPFMWLEADRVIVKGGEPVF